MAMQPFFSDAPRITVHDALAEFLGSCDDGMIEYGYADAVRVAGHSCPTVAGAYLMALAGLHALYPDAIPERGGIEVAMSSGEEEGTTGVIAQVFTLLTGAAASNGFHGIGGRFRRHGLLRYGEQMPGFVARFRRTDTGDAVYLDLDVSSVPAAPDLRLRMTRALQPDPDIEERRGFAATWQDRVRRLLLEHGSDPAVIRVVRQPA
ncbi:MAG TPA: hypothetical protein PK361_07340 [Chiayiivirga sp.]|nr:hypothetical protein [Chiayiivirga sp.]HRQ35409.1 hypothetical protein [Chiayiivirga sp.]